MIGNFAIIDRHNYGAMTYDFHHDFNWHTHFKHISRNEAYTHAMGRIFRLI